jgi:GT2 family glycosyltransferase
LSRAASGTEPVASVILCVYNRAQQVVPCLESLLRLDFTDHELVLVDDGSTDDSLRVLEEFAAAHPERAIQVVHHSPNRGVSGARNAGLAASRGRYVAFTDSDCVVDPGWLGALVAAFTESGDPTIAGVGGTVHDHPPRTWAERAYIGTCRVGVGAVQGRPLVGNNMAFRGDLARELLFEEALTYGCDEDELVWRLEQLGYRCTFTPDAVVHHNHAMDLAGYLRMARNQGRGSARFWYKKGQGLGRDLIVLYAAVLALPLGLFDPRLPAVPAALLVLQLGLLWFAEVRFKGKGWGEALLVLPINFLHNLNKGWSVLRTVLRLVLGRGEEGIREARRRWRERLPELQRRLGTAESAESAEAGDAEPR